MSSSSTNPEEKIIWGPCGIPYIAFNMNDTTAPEQIKVCVDDKVIFSGYNPNIINDENSYHISKNDHGNYRYFLSCFYYGSNTFQGPKAEFFNSKEYLKRKISIIFKDNKDIEKTIFSDTFSIENYDYDNMKPIDIYTDNYHIELYIRDISSTGTSELASLAIQTI